MYLPRCASILLVVVVAVLAAGPAVAETVFAYYPFDQETSSVTPDGQSDNDLTLGADNGAPATIDSASMFGAGAVKSTQVEAYAQLANGDPDFDVAYTQFSIALWANQAGGWAEGTSSRSRYLAGKYATGSNRGWSLDVRGGAVNQICLSAFSTNDPHDPNLFAITDMDTALAADEFHHVVATFDAAGTSPETQIAIYVDGIRQQGLDFSTKYGTPPEPISHLNGVNANNFQILNRGLTANDPNAGGGFIGSIDDCLLATGPVLTDKQVALLHGLGRLAGVSYGSGTINGEELASVLDAYDAQGLAVAGGETWYYSDNVGGGNTIGTIGGSVATGDAFIVLGTDGSGVNLVPEPGCLTLLLGILVAFTALRCRVA